KLEGEAFFEVSRDPSRPFCILSSGLLTRVLGTSFNIESYRKSNAVVVTVATGHVAVEKLGDKISSRISDLLPGQQLSFNLQNQSANIYPVNVADVIAWKENRLVFDNTSFARIALSIERLYGVRVIYPEKTLAKTPFTARFSSNAPLAEVMRVLASTGQFSYTIKDSVVHIKNKAL
ncbi:MAG: DUF4974 domain-containing protein, partial [Mucilaginibacter polytrichastri]|nr:DUF4974 domain-containing protein [Mucilaginibacter polytrichastri]